MHSSLVNFTVTDRAWLIVTVQVPVPEQASDQPENTEPLAGAAVSVTLVPKRKLREQVGAQLMPGGFELTVPEPVPDRLTLKVTGRSVNVALTDLAWVMLTVQVPVPEQSPDHPKKLEPVAGVAVRVTLFPWSNACEQVEPQLIPAGLEVTVPDPDLDTLNVSGVAVKFAITDFALSIVRSHAPVPEQAPDHPAKTEPVAGVAVSATGVAASYACEHVDPQSIPAGLEVTVPEPDPILTTPAVTPHVPFDVSIAAFCVPHCGVPSTSGLATVSMLVPQATQGFTGSGDAPA